MPLSPNSYKEPLKLTQIHQFSKQNENSQIKEFSQNLPNMQTFQNFIKTPKFSSFKENLENKENITQNQYYDEYNEIPNENIELFDEPNDLLCSEKIQDLILQKAQSKDKEKLNYMMPHIIEEINEEDISNNCSPNKTELINAIVNKQSIL